MSGNIEAVERLRAAVDRLREQVRDPSADIASAHIAARITTGEESERLVAKFDEVDASINELRAICASLSVAVLSMADVLLDAPPA